MRFHAHPRVLAALVVLGAGCFSLTACQSLPATELPQQKHSPVRLAFSKDATPPEDLSPQQLDNLVPIDPGDARFANNQDLTPADADARQGEIDARYSVGDVLSPADSEFIRMTAVPAQAVKDAAQSDDASGSGDIALASDVHTELADTRRFTDSGSGAGGTGRLSGTATENYSDNPFNISGNWSIAYSSSGSSKVRKIRSAAHFRSYGAVGSKGLIGLVYSADPSDTVSGNSAYFARKASYSAYQVYFTFSYDATFYTSTGSFEVAD